MLEADLEERPEATLVQRGEFLEWALGVSQATPCRWIRRMGYTRKKDDGCQRTRRVVESRLAGDGGRLGGLPEVGVVDECGTHVSLAPVFAYAPKGERARCKVPRNRGKNTTLIASMTTEGMGPCVAVEGSTKGEIFEAYVEQVLVLLLEPGRIVVMNNLPAHKGQRVRELIEGRSCEVLFLPSYSPDLNPIEEAFSKIKGILRRAGARARDALVEAIGGALSAVTAQDARSFFEHCGYHLRGQQL